MEAEKKVIRKIYFSDLFSKERIAKGIFIALAIFSILAVFTIVGFVLYAAIPAFRTTGFFNFVFGTTWSGDREIFGIWKMIVGTFVLTLCAVLLGGPLAVFTAVWLVFYCPKPLRKVYNQIVNLLAGIPSIVYGLFGYKFLMPFLTSVFHPTNIGFGLLSSTLILSIMILPTITAVTKNSLNSVPMHYYEGALGVGCSKNQAVWRVLLPAAKSGVVSALVLGIGRAVGETMAVQMIVGNGSGYPLGAFMPFTTLTSLIVNNWGYALPNERTALIADGFVLLIFILMLNLVLLRLKKESKGGNKFFSRRLKESDRNDTLKCYKHSGSIQDILWILSWVIAMLVAATLVFIVLFVFVKGFPNLSTDFLFSTDGIAQKTIFPSFMATIMLIGLALVIALPLGIGAAIYLNEYAKRGGFMVKTIRLFVDTLSGIPSIIFGLFGAVFFVKGLGLGYSIMSGGITLAIMILPTVIRSTEQSLSEVPDSMREASYALGAGKLRTVFVVVLPNAISGIVTSIILSIGRIINESAVLIFTVGSESAYMPEGFLDGISSLAVYIWKLLSAGLPEDIDMAYATASVLLVFVIILNILVTFSEWLFNKRKKI